MIGFADQLPRSFNNLSIIVSVSEPIAFGGENRRVVVTVTHDNRIRMRSAISA